MLKVKSEEKMSEAELTWLAAHLDEFSNKGLRTLLLGYRWLSEEEY